MKIVAEQWANDGLHEAVALKQHIDPRQLMIDHVKFACSPLDFSPPAKDMDAAKAVAAMRQTLAENKEWLPTLTVADKEETQKGIRSDGSINDKPVRGTTGRKINKARNALGALGGNAGPKSELSAMYIDFVVHVPGQPDAHYRRTIMDMLGPAKRAAGDLGAPSFTPEQKFQRTMALLTQTQTLILPGRMTRVVAERLDLVHQIHNSLAVTHVLGALADDDTDSIIDGLSQQDPLPGPLYTWATLRDAWSPQRGQWFVNEPIVANLHTQVSMQDNGAMHMRLATDIVNNPVQPGPAFEGDAFALRLKQGVLDTAIEAAALHGPQRHSAQHRSALVALAPCQCAMVRRSVAQSVDRRRRGTPAKRAAKGARRRTHEADRCRW